MLNFDAIKEAEFHCPICDKIKAVRRPSKKPIPDPERVLDAIEGDIVKIKPFPKNKKGIILFLVDRKARFRWAFLMPNKKGPIKGFFRALRNKYGQYPRKFHFDGGTEVNKLLKSWLSIRGIEFSTSSPYIHEQNGLIERSIRVILDRLRAIMIGANLPLYLWCYVLPAIVELVNCSAVTNRDLTPFQMLYDELEPGTSHNPNLGHYRSIGAYCEVLIPFEQRFKA